MCLQKMMVMGFRGRWDWGGSCRSCKSATVANRAELGGSLSPETMVSLQAHSGDTWGLRYSSAGKEPNFEMGD
jgi:hypothetical protein